MNSKQTNLLKELARIRIAPDEIAEQALLTVSRWQREQVNGNVKKGF